MPKVASSVSASSSKRGGGGKTKGGVLPRNRLEKRKIRLGKMGSVNKCRDEDVETTKKVGGGKKGGEKTMTLRTPNLPYGPYKPIKSQDLHLHLNHLRHLKEDSLRKSSQKKEEHQPRSLQQLKKTVRQTTSLVQPQALLQPPCPAKLNLDRANINTFYSLDAVGSFDRNRERKRKEEAQAIANSQRRSCAPSPFPSPSFFIKKGEVLENYFGIAHNQDHNTNPTGLLNNKQLEQLDLYTNPWSSSPSAFSTPPNSFNLTFSHKFYGMGFPSLFYLHGGQELLFTIKEEESDASSEDSRL